MGGFELRRLRSRHSSNGAWSTFNNSTPVPIDIDTVVAFGALFQTPKEVIKTSNKMPIFAKNVDCEEYADAQEADEEMTRAVATEEDKNKARVMDEKNFVWSLMIGMFETFLT
jgi:hypothetical protein